MTFADYFANRKFFEKHEVAKCAVIAATLAVLFYFAPLNYGHIPIRCPICGKETEGEYIVYNGNRYCLKDGSQILYDDGVYNFYELKKPLPVGRAPARAKGVSFLLASFSI